MHSSYLLLGVKFEFSNLFTGQEKGKTQSLKYPYKVSFKKLKHKYFPLTLLLSFWAAEAFFPKMIKTFFFLLLVILRLQTTCAGMQKYKICFVWSKLMAISWVSTVRKASQCICGLYREHSKSLSTTRVHCYICLIYLISSPTSQQYSLYIVNMFKLFMEESISDRKYIW